MKFSWHDTLRRITGSETRCPVCRADGLVVWERKERDVLPDLRGIPYCECPHCKVRGDLAELLAKATDRSVEDTVRELLRIGELEACGRDVETYITRKCDQLDVDGHMLRCVERLRGAPHMGGIRAGLSVASLRQLPPDTGLHIPQSAPRQFALLSGPRYSMVPMTLYRYRFDGETTCVDAQNPKTLQREHRIRITGDVGVYLGDYRLGEVPPVVVGTPNPRIAGQIYGALRAESSLPTSVIGIAGFPLPRRFDSVRILYLLDTPDAPLPLQFAVRAISGHAVYGVDRELPIKVLSPQCQSSEITAADIRALSDSRSHGKPIRTWIAQKVLELADRREEVANALLQAEASENIRSEIVELLGPDAPPALAETVMLPTADPDDVFTLGNGKMIKVTPVGIYTAVRKSGEIVTKSLLSNVGITVDSRIVDRGLETASCTVTHPDHDVPAMSVRIPRQHWNNPDAIAEDIRAAYATCGRTPYIAMYKASGYGWGDIFQYLGSHCPVQTGIRALGATAEGTVNTPNAVISGGKSEKQTKAGLLNPNALAAYSELPATVPDAADEFLRGFLKTPATLDKTGVAAGLLHTLYCATGRLFDRSGTRRPPTHLVFVETEPGIWDGVMRTLAYVFSGSEYVPLTDYGDRLRFLHEWACLGTLPFVTRLPSADMAATLSDSPVSVIAVADPLTAISCSVTGTVTFVLPNVETGCTDGLSHDDIVALREALCAYMIKKAGTGWLDVNIGSATALATPCLTVLGSVTDCRSPETVAGGLYRSIRSRYPGVGMTGSRAFFWVLHREYLARERGEDPNVPITIVTGAPPDSVKASFNERGEHVFVLEDMVLVSRSVVHLINQEKTFLFDAEQLSHEFEENGILLQDAPRTLGIDSRRVWIFPRSVWDEAVVRPTGFNTRKDIDKNEH